MKQDTERDRWLRDRLKEAVRRFANDSADEFGRLLGYKNGGYIREMLREKDPKPVRSALLDRVAETQNAELARWFEGAPGRSVQQGSYQLETTITSSGTAENLTVALRYLANVMAASDPMTREAAAPLLSKLATDPGESAKIANMVGALVQAGDRTGRLFKAVGIKSLKAEPIGNNLPLAPPGGEERRLHQVPVQEDRRSEPFMYVGSDVSRTISQSDNDNTHKEPAGHPRTKKR